MRIVLLTAVLAVAAPPATVARAAADDSLLARAEAVLAEVPDHAGAMIVAARALTAAGAADRAIDMLERAFATGVDVDPDAEAFRALAGSSRFEEFAAKARARRADATDATAVLHLKEPDLAPEGIAWDPVTRTVFVGSIPKHKIIAISADGRSTDLADENDGLRKVLGMAVDAERRLLWAASYTGTASPTSHQVSTLSAFTLPDGGVARRIDMPVDDPHLFNDVAPASDGSVFVTDTIAGTVYRLAPGDATLEPIVPPGTLQRANGIALDEPRGRLYVADLGHGIAVVDLASGSVTALDRADGVAVCGIDGLYLDHGALVAVQNSCGLPRIVRLALNDVGTRAVSQEVLLRQGGPLELPTTAVVAGDDLLLVGDSLVDLLQNDGSLRDDPRVVPPTVLKVPLRH